MDNYVISIYDNKKNDAGPKAKQDIDKFLTEKDFKIIKLKFDLHGSLVSKMKKIKYALWDIPRAFKNRRMDTIVLQYPLYSLVLMKQLIKNARKYSNAKLLFVIHDVESLRLFKNNAAYVAAEIELLNVADGLIVHNDKMLAWLKQHGVTTQMVSLQIFDYDNTQELQRSETFKKDVCFAGNLKKAKFLEKMTTQNEVDIYGPNPAKTYSNGLVYKGIYSPEELPKHLTQNFGLVWDGTALSACNGVYGEYMKFNNPHKASLYLSSGIPVIIWKQAALADFIEANGVGIALESLADLDHVLASISASEYKEMRQNAIKVGQKMRTGHFTKTAFSKFHF